MSTIKQSVVLHGQRLGLSLSLLSSWRRSHVVTRDTVARASIQDCLLRGATWLCVRGTNRSSVTGRTYGEYVYIFPLIAIPLKP